MSLGKLLYHAYHKPKGVITNTLKQGIYNTWQINKGKKEMGIAAMNLQQPIFDSKPKNNLPNFSFLTGKNFWYMTAFCAYSLCKVTRQNIHFTFYDDGSFDQEIIAKIHQQFPICTIVTQDEINTRLIEIIPESKFPFIHYKRKVYPHIRKLTDVHAGNNGYQLLLDSDMLFWKKPQLMLDWLASPQEPFYILDVENAYYYSFTLMEELTGISIPQRVNVGAIGLKSKEIDWEKLEFWVKTLEEKEGSNYLLEQALSAMLVASQKCKVAPEVDYIVKPDKNTTLRKVGILHHYVAESKEWYYREMWKKL